MSKTFNLLSVGVPLDSVTTFAELTADADARYLKKDGSNADTTIDIGVENLETTGEITGEMAKVQASAPAEVVGNLWLDPNGSGGGTTDHAELDNLAFADSGHTGFEPAKGDDDNYVTDAEKIIIGNTSGTNTGDQVADGVTITGAGTVADPFVGSGGTTDHSELDNLAYADSGHTGFEPTIAANTYQEKDATLTALAALDSTAGVLTQTGADTFAKADSNKVGGMTLVDTASPSAAANFTISSLSAGTYYLTFTWTQNTSTGQPRLTFNADTGNNYGWGNWVAHAAGSGAGNTSALKAVAFIPITGNTIVATGVGISHIYFTTNGNNIYYLNHSAEYRGSTPFWEITVSGGTYQGAATLSSLTITDTAGTMTGEARLYKYN